MAIRIDIPVTLPPEILEQPTLIRAAFREPIRRAILSSMALIQREAKLAAPVNTGFLRNTIMIRILERGSAFIGHLTTSAFYAPFVEEGFGGKNKFPPNDPIERWVRQKKLAPTGRVAEEAEKRGLSGDEAIGLITFAIRASIAKKGVKGQRFLQGAVTKTLPKIARIMANEIQKEFGSP